MGTTLAAQDKLRKTLAVDIDTFKAQIDAVDTRYGGDEIVADLIGTLDRMVETMENHGRVYRRRRHQTAGVSGYRNVHWHEQSKRWTGRIGWTDARGKRHRKSVGYYREAADASQAVEELRTKMGL